MPPHEWIVSRICEEFSCTPSAALREWRRHRHLVVAIIDLRAYARAYDRVERARDGEEFDGDAYADRVMRHAARKARAALDARRKRTG